MGIQRWIWDTKCFISWNWISFVSLPRLAPDSLFLLSPQPTGAHPDGPPVANDMDAFFPPWFHYTLQNQTLDLWQTYVLLPVTWQPVNLPTPLEEFHSFLQNLTQSPRAPEPNLHGLKSSRRLCPWSKKKKLLNLKHWEPSLPRARGKAEGKWGLCHFMKIQETQSWMLRLWFVSGSQWENPL